MTRAVRVGGLPIGGGAPIVIQSMTNTDTRDAEATLAQIHRLEEAGCQIVRLSVYDEGCIASLPAILQGAHVPLVADIHFNASLAVQAVEAGIHKLRINPGNIGNARRVAYVADAAKAHGVPIRIGVNSGSLHRDILAKHGGPTPAALAESALEEVRALEKAGFSDIVISVKATSVQTNLEANRILSRSVDYPLHLGVTEAGTRAYGAVKSAAGLAPLLLDGIGDTIRVSLSGDPVPEVAVARDILRAVGLYHEGVEVISCPTCGRCGIDVAGMAARVEEATRHVRIPMKIAVMGCIVNGPGEAREADMGIAGGREYGLLFVKGKPMKKLPIGELLPALLEEVEAYLCRN